jgi:hypothetical protein
MPYKTQSPDTHPEIERIQIEGYRRMTPAQKLERVWGLDATVRALQMAEIRSRHPDADDRECLLRMASRRLPADVMRKVFNWDPDKQGY